LSYEEPRLQCLPSSRTEEPLFEHWRWPERTAYTVQGPRPETIRDILKLSKKKIARCLNADREGDAGKPYSAKQYRRLCGMPAVQLLSGTQIAELTRMVVTVFPDAEPGKASSMCAAICDSTLSERDWAEQVVSVFPEPDGTGSWAKRVHRLAGVPFDLVSGLRLPDLDHRRSS